MEFSNLQVDLSSIPDFKKVELKSISKKYKTVLWIGWLIPFFILMPLPGFSLLFFEVPYLYVVGIYLVITVLFLFTAIEIHKGFPRRKFGVRELDIIHQKGFFVFTETVVPFKRAQHVEIKQGPLLRLFQLYSLKIYTAGASTGDLVINGINFDTAEKLKSKILQVAEIEEDENFKKPNETSKDFESLDSHTDPTMKKKQDE